MRWLRRSVLLGAVAVLGLGLSACDPADGRDLHVQLHHAPVKLAWNDTAVVRGGVSNEGSAAATGAQVYLAPSPGLTARLEVEGGSSCALTEAGATLCSLSAPLAPGELREFEVVVTSQQLGTTGFNVVAWSSAYEPDPDPHPNLAAAGFEVANREWRQSISTGTPGWAEYLPYPPPNSGFEIDYRPYSAEVFSDAVFTLELSGDVEVLGASGGFVVGMDGGPPIEEYADCRLIGRTVSCLLEGSIDLERVWDIGDWYRFDVGVVAGPGLLWLDAQIVAVGADGTPMRASRSNEAMWVFESDWE